MASSSALSRALVGDGRSRLPARDPDGAGWGQHRTSQPPDLQSGFSERIASPATTEALRLAGSIKAWPHGFEAAILTGLNRVCRVGETQPSPHKPCHIAFPRRVSSVPGTFTGDAGVQILQAYVVEEELRNVRASGLHDIAVGMGAAAAR
jgi:hypothetical protein